MKKWIKRLFIISAIVILTGCIIMGAGVVLNRGRFAELVVKDGSLTKVEGLSEMKKSPKTTLPSFDSIDMKISNADIMIIPTDGEFAISYNMKGITPEYSVDNGKLTFAAEGENLISFSFTDAETNTVSVFVPKGQKLSDLMINSGSGDVSVSGITASTLDLTLSQGDVFLKDVAASTISLTLDCGDAEIFRTTADKLLKINDSLGDIDIDNSEFESIEAALSCGDAELENVTVNSSANIDNALGDIDISLKNNICSYELETSDGEISINDHEMENGIGQSAKFDAPEGPFIKATNSCGDIELNYR